MPICWSKIGFISSFALSCSSGVVGFIFAANLMWEAACCSIGYAITLLAVASILFGKSRSAQAGSEAWRWDSSSNVCSYSVQSLCGSSGTVVASFWVSGFSFGGGGFEGLWLVLLLGGPSVVLSTFVVASELRSMSR